MQLPRGTFHSIKKHVPCSSVLRDVVVSQFTGSIHVSFPGGISILVLQKGAAILATHQGLCGTEAWQKVQQMGEAAVDAELATLNETQLTLAKEFNKPCEIKNGSVSSIIFGNKESSPVPDAVPVQGKQVTHHRPRERNPGEGEIENLINGDLEALERIDLNKISGKFRVNAESIARELNLDHLVADQ